MNVSGLSIQKKEYKFICTLA